MSVALDPAKPIIEFVREDDLRLVFTVLIPIPHLSIFATAQAPWSRLAYAEYAFDLPTPALDNSDAGAMLRAAERFAATHGLDPSQFFHEILTAFSRATGVAA